MVALDVDGTVALKDYSVPESIKAAIGQAVASGAVVSLVTGRMRRSALRYAETCETNGPTASYQGGIITAPDGKTDTHSETLDPKLATSAVSRMRNVGAHINVYLKDEIWVERESDWASRYAERMQTRLNVTDSLTDIAAEGATLVMAVDEPEKIGTLAASLRPALGADAAVTQSLPHFCEVASARATKGQALAAISTGHGFGPDEVIAIGDGEGDVSMIEWAGLGVAVRDAHPLAVAASDMQIEGPEMGGVADLIRDLLKQGKLGR